MAADDLREALAAQTEARAQAAAAAVRYAEAHVGFWQAVRNLEAANRKAKESADV